jgi:hypothetical protein
MNQKLPEQELYHELTYYTLSHRGSQFIHQHIVDAFTAQTANAYTKPIALTFALVGLYLLAEKNYSGRQVQQAHLKMAKNKRTWLSFDLPDDRGAITVSDVLAAPAGKDRDELIKKWCLSVWQAYNSSHVEVAELAKDSLNLDSSD